MEALTVFWDKLYSGEIISENRKHRLKEPFLTTKMLKLTRPQILEQSSGTRHLFVAFFFSDHCIKQTDSMLQWVCSVILRSKNASKCGKNISDLFIWVSCMCHFTVFTTLIYYWTDAWQHGIYLLKVLQSAMIITNCHSTHPPSFYKGITKRGDVIFHSVSQPYMVIVLPPPATRS